MPPEQTSSSHQKLPLVGIDTGGTFTDFVYLGVEGHLQTCKVLSTPDDPARAIITGLKQLGLDQTACRLAHGTTVGTNAVLEGKGARVAFVTNQGFADLLTLGRQNRADIYSLSPEPEAPPVPPELCIEVPVRIAADGSELEPLDQKKTAELIDQIKAVQPEAVAICLLFSWLDAGHEQQLAEALARTSPESSRGASPESLFVSCSSDILPAIGEYERGITTWLNARVGGMLERYLQNLQAQLPQARIAVMQSSGHTIAARLAGKQAVRLLLSGPAGGLAAVASIGRLTNEPRLLSFDMGGTSTDVALVDKRPVLTSKGRIGRWPVAVPMVDMHTIGAGGGSIAWLDSAGGLQVGPQSAGADPGPACYGQGGLQPTVTDAHVVLGHIPDSARLAGNLQLDKDAARQSFAVIASALNMDIEQAASGVLDIANEHMARALRVMSAERGHDPTTLTLTSFGGAGGLHVCALAERLGMNRALVPVHGGVLSALGMLLAAPGRELTQSQLRLMDDSAIGSINIAIEALADEAFQQLTDEGIDAHQITLRPQLDCRYHGQSHSITVDWFNDAGDAVAAACERFEQQHEQQNGHRLQRPVELVNVRITASGEPRMGSLPDIESSASDEVDQRQQVCGVEQAVAVINSRQIPQVAMGDDGLIGPAIIIDQLATMWLAPDWTAELDKHGNLLLHRLQA